MLDAAHRDPGTMNGATARRRHLMHVFPSFQMGGVPIRIATIINRLGDRFRHTIVAMDDGYACKARLDPEIEVGFASVVSSHYNLLRTLAGLRAVLRDADPDLLLTYNWGAIEWPLANLLSPVCPHLHFESGFGPEEADGQIYRRALTRRVALSRTRHVIVPSRTLMDIATKVWRLNPRKLLYIPNGVDCHQFSAAPEPDIIPGFAKAPGELIVGTAAPLRPEKNLGHLVRAFAPLTQDVKVRLLILGDGRERAKLATLAEELGIADKVLLPGHMDAVEKALGWFDVFAMSSETEQMPNSLLQAMAAGLPAAATDVGDIKGIVAPENGPFVVPKSDTQALTGALARLLADPALRGDLGQRNRERVRAHFALDQMVEAYRTLFETACGAPGHVEAPR